MYTRKNFDGNSVGYCHKGNRVEIPLAGTGFEDRLTSSIAEAGKQHFKVAVSSGAGRLENKRLSFYNDVISNIVLEPYDYQINPAVTVFRDGGCTGRSARLSWVVGGAKNVYFDTDAMRDMGIN